MKIRRHWACDMAAFATILMWPYLIHTFESCSSNSRLPRNLTLQKPWMAGVQRRFGRLFEVGLRFTHAMFWWDLECQWVPCNDILSLMSESNCLVSTGLTGSRKIRRKWDPWAGRSNLSSSQSLTCHFRPESCSSSPSHCDNAISRINEPVGSTRLCRECTLTQNSDAQPVAQSKRDVLPH